MDSDYDIFEVATVIRDFWLIDSDSYQRKYNTWHGRVLTPGHYVVNWPMNIRDRRFNEHAVFHGPFLSRDDAQTTRDRMHKEVLSNQCGFDQNKSLPSKNEGQVLSKVACRKLTMARREYANRLNQRKIARVGS